MKKALRKIIAGLQVLLGIFLIIGILVLGPYLSLLQEEALKTGGLYIERPRFFLIMFILAVLIAGGDQMVKGFRSLGNVSQKSS